MEDLEFLEPGVEEVPNNIEHEDDNFLMTYDWPQRGKIIIILVFCIDLTFICFKVLF